MILSQFKTTKMRSVLCRPTSADQINPKLFVTLWTISAFGTRIEYLRVPAYYFLVLADTKNFIWIRLQIPNRYIFY